MRILLFAFCIFIISCNKGDDIPMIISEPEPEPEVDPCDLDMRSLLAYRYVPSPRLSGFVEAVYNEDFHWNASGKALYQDPHPTNTKKYLYLYFESVETDYSFRRERLAFTEIPAQSGVESILSGTIRDYDDGYASVSFATLQDDGDVLDDLFSGTICCNSWVSVTKFDTVANLVEGEFEFLVYYDSTSPKENDTYPDSLRFSCGKFSVPLVR